MRRFKWGKYFLTGTQATDWMHIILFSESSGTNKGSGFQNWTYPVGTRESKYVRSTYLVGSARTYDLGA